VEVKVEDNVLQVAGMKNIPIELNAGGGGSRRLGGSKSSMDPVALHLKAELFMMTS
jgi:hypothetical protein